MGRGCRKVARLARAEHVRRRSGALRSSLKLAKRLLTPLRLTHSFPILHCHLNRVVFMNVAVGSYLNTQKVWISILANAKGDRLIC
jgi:hypothetical protein